MELSSQDVAMGMGTALAVGALVGLERERRNRAEKQPMFGGIRTFPLIALLGALSGLSVGAFGVLGIAVPFVGVCAFLLAAYVKVPRTEEKPSLGLTSEFAAVLVFFIGAVPFLEGIPLNFNERLVLAGACGAVVMAALALREPLHKLVEAVSAEDVFATVRFVLLAVVVLPLLPDRTWDMFQALNPRSIGMVVVLIAAISFVGYVAVRLLGDKRGIGVTAVFGGLASSTASTLTFSERAKKQPELTRMAAFATVLACTIMLPRLAVMISLMHAPLLPYTGPTLGAMAAGCVVGAVVLWRYSLKAGQTRVIPKDGEEGAKDKHLNNPFSVKQALKLGLVYAAIRLVAAAANYQFHDAGLLVAAALAGLTDVDAITISVTRMFANEEISANVAALSVSIAVLSNTFVKAGIAFFVGGRRLGMLVAAVLLPSAGLGIAAALLL